MTLHTYMIYSRSLGSAQGAFLVFAHTGREARKVGWPYAEMTDQYIDLAVMRIRGSTWLFDQANKEKLNRDEAHVIDDPKSCSSCFFWDAPIGDDGLCSDCREGVDDDRRYY